jgi:hypothetical protein
VITVPLLHSHDTKVQCREYDHQTSLKI